MMAEVVSAQLTMTSGRKTWFWHRFQSFKQFKSVIESENNSNPNSPKKSFFCEMYQNELLNLKFVRSLKKLPKWPLKADLHKTGFTTKSWESGLNFHKWFCRSTRTMSKVFPKTSWRTRHYPDTCLGSTSWWRSKSGASQGRFGLLC